MIKNFLTITLNTILILLVLLGILVVISFIPFTGNYKVFTVQSGSMSPSISTGSLIFVKSESDYNVGDVITRKTNDQKIPVTHRIISKEKEEGNEKIIFHTKGDANDSPDMQEVFQSNIIGKVFLSVPLIGYPVNYAKTPTGLILIIIIPAVIIIYDEAQKIKKEILKKIDYRKRMKKREETLNNKIEEKNEETQI